MNQTSALLPVAWSEQMVQSLWTDLLDPWFSRCIDSVGGFQQGFSRDWTIIPDAERFIVHQSRIVWVASTVARCFSERRSAMEPIIEHGLSYIETRFLNPQSGAFYWTLSTDGTVADKDGYAYGVAFGLYACAASYRATGDLRALEMAMGAFNWLDSHLYDDTFGGWHDRADSDGVPIKVVEGEPKYGFGVGAPVGYKVQNTHLHVLEALSELYLGTHDDRVGRRLADSIDIMANRMFDDRGTLHSLMTRDWKPIPGSVSFGHDVEAAFLMMEGALALGTYDLDVIKDRGKRLIDHALQHGFDLKTGGFAELGASDGAVSDSARGWWTQAEGLLALVMAAKLWPEEPMYLEAARVQWEWISTKQIDHVHRGWFARVQADGQAVAPFDKGGQWKACYHEARALIYSSRLLLSLPL